MGDEHDTGEFHYRGELRGGGWVGVTDDAFVLSLANQPTESIDLTDITDVQYERMSWTLVVLSLVVVLFGALSLAQSRFLVGGGALLGGLFSLVFAYGRRDQVGVAVADQPAPMKFYPADATGLLDALDVVRDG